MTTLRLNLTSVTLSRINFLAAIVIAGLLVQAPAAVSLAQESLPDRKLGEGYKYLGQIQPRHARDIQASNWSVGAETMDRDYTVYANWREHLGPLGTKKARIQSGWAKTEKQPGVYNWEWVDEIVLDMVAQGVEPWVCLCYGNPIYPGGGDTGLGGGLVASEEALQAWERYVAAFVQRYSEHVDEWELWNEPRTGRGKGAVQYGDFVIRTATVIREIQPRAEIMFAAGGSFDTQFAQEVLEHLQQQGKLELVNTIIYHPYAYNPDERQDAALELRRIAKTFAEHIDIRQGENGAPSKPGSFGAISGNEWTEQAQAKWATRRLLGDLGRDIPSSYFAICDMVYPTRINYKGLLAINDDKTVDHRKQAYHAVQHITAIFDNSLIRIRDFDFQLSSARTDGRHSVFGYRTASDGTLITIWRSSDTPDKRPETERVALTLPGCSFSSPVWIDLLSGGVYAVSKDLWSRDGNGTTFSGLAVYDSAVVLADLTDIEHVLKEATAKSDVPTRVLPRKANISCDVELSGVKRAVAELSSDWQRVLGAPLETADATQADLVVRLDTTLERPESYRIDVGERQVH